MRHAAPSPGKLLLTLGDHHLVMVAFRRQMVFATPSIEAVMVRNNVAMVAEEVETVLSMHCAPTLPIVHHGVTRNRLYRERRPVHAAEYEHRASLRIARARDDAHGRSSTI